MLCYGYACHRKGLGSLSGSKIWKALSPGKMLGRKPVIVCWKPNHVIQLYFSVGQLHTLSKRYCVLLNGPVSARLKSCLKIRDKVWTLLSVNDPQTNLLRICYCKRCARLVASVMALKGAWRHAINTGLFVLLLLLLLFARFSIICLSLWKCGVGCVDLKGRNLMYSYFDAAKCEDYAKGM